MPTIEEKKLELYNMGFTYVIDVPNRNRRFYANKAIYSYEDEIFLEEGADFFEETLATADTEKSSLLFSSFVIPDSLNQTYVNFTYIKNISIDKIKYFYLKEQYHDESLYFLDNQKRRAERKKEMKEKIEKFLENGIIDTGDYLLGGHDRHDRSWAAEDEAQEFSNKFCKINGCGIHTYEPQFLYEPQLNQQPDTLYLIAYDDGVSNHPCNTVAYLTISEESRYAMTAKQLERLFAEGYLG
jgi:hypothetical protein